MTSNWYLLENRTFEKIKLKSNGNYNINTWIYIRHDAIN